MPPEEAEAALRAHPDLYERRGDRIALRIEAGSLSLGSQHAVGYGYEAAIAWGERTPAHLLDAELAARSDP